MRRPTSWIPLALLGSTLAAPTSAQVTQRVNVPTGGTQANGNGDYPSLSADGRYVAFTGLASDLVAGDSNGTYDVFVRDRLLGTTGRASVDSAGIQGDFASFSASISGDGRFVAFLSGSTNLVLGDANGFDDVFVHDRQSGATERVSVDSAGIEANSFSLDPVISGDGRYVAFRSDASNLVPGDTNGFDDLFVRDRQTGTTTRVSVDSSGAESNGDSFDTAISADGRFVAFGSSATNLVAVDANGSDDAFVHDRQTGTTALVSLSWIGAQGNSGSYPASITPDGRFVAFSSAATQLVQVDPNGTWDVFVRDRQSATTECVSLSSSEVHGNNVSDHASISADGRYVAFWSNATNLFPADLNGFDEVFLRDRQNGTTIRVSVGAGAAQGNGSSLRPSISADGGYVAFDSQATDLVPGDTNGAADVFVRDIVGGTDFTTLCKPGAGGVIACPCSNPPASLGRGCDNSAATGGAILTALGGAFLSSDSLMFQTSGATPAEMNIVVQGNALVSGGLVYGQGVRCVSGSLKRLFVKTASVGTILAPEFAAGDPSLSARSAAKGDPIQAGQSRWYFVYYRDPAVLGGCPAVSHFNATQAGQVTWSP